MPDNGEQEGADVEGMLIEYLQSLEERISALEGKNSIEEGEE